VPILETKTDHSAVRRILVATSLGGIFGLQSLKLSEFGLAASIPLYASLSIFLSHAMLGCSVGVTAGFTWWWRRGWVLGLLFSIPAALGAHALGLSYAPYGVAMIVTGLVTGLLVAFLTDTLVPFHRKSTRQPCDVLPPSSQLESLPARECKMDTIRQRLAAEKACLEDLDTERRRRHDSGFGMTTEDRVIWRELLDLELQEIDEQVNRIGSAAGVAGDAPREPWWTGRHPYKRGSS
jgi:hypothetical protein